MLIHTVIFVLSLAYADNNHLLSTEGDLKPAESAEPARETVTETSYLTSTWPTDYGAAMEKAKNEKKKLLIFFGELDPKKDKEPFLPSDAEALKNFVVVKLPKDAKIKAGDKEVELLKHPAFSSALGKEGLVILDFSTQDSELYGRVVSLLPKEYFKNKHYASHLLNLPEGTLTQRSMVWAVRVHPEAPQSTFGKPDPKLMKTATLVSLQQVGEGVQHHDRETRYMYLNAKEVVAETWPLAHHPENRHVIPAAIDLIKSWRGSPGHWGAVRGRWRVFGYDMQFNNRNGKWYGTGLVGPER